MSVVENLPAASGFEGVLAHRTVLLDKYRSFRSSLQQNGFVSERVFELVRRRVAYIHGCEAELAMVDAQVNLTPNEEEALGCGEFACFSAAEQSALTLAELVPHSVHSITDDLIHEVSAQFGHPGCVALLTAVAFYDVECRLKIVFEVPVEPGEITPAAL